MKQTMYVLVDKETGEISIQQMKYSFIEDSARASVIGFKSREGLLKLIDSTGITLDPKTEEIRRVEFEI